MFNKRPDLPSPANDRCVEELFQKIVGEKSVLQCRKRATVFSQGDLADAIYFVELGRIKITATSAKGREGVLAILGPRNFVGEECLIGHDTRKSNAIAIDLTTLFRIDKVSMLHALAEQPKLAGIFIADLLARNIDLEESLCDQLFHDSEKRLARVLMRLARLEGCVGSTGIKIRRVTHETLAEMVGTTRPHITSFMNKFRKMGLIEYDGGILIRTEALHCSLLED